MPLTEQPLQFHRTIPGAITRRRALAWMAASTALAGTGCTPAPRERIHAWIDMPEARGDSDPLFYASAVLREGYAMGVLVGTRGGRPVKVEGNPLHPCSLGATDPFAQAAVLQLWDPDRSQTVAQRLAAAGTRTANQATALSSWSAFESAWRPLAARLQSSGGEGLRLLTGPVTSPTLRAQITGWQQALPRARWHQHHPLMDEAAADGAVAAFGQPTDSVAHVDRAQVIVALGCDPFSEGPGCVRHAMDWATQRRTGAPARLFAAEVQPGLFGARSDARIALPPGAIDALLQRLGARIGGAPGVPSGDAALDAFETRVAESLRTAGAGALVFTGSCLAPATHAAVHALHRQLGAVGQTVTALPALARAREAASLPELVRDMRVGIVDTLVILDGNPVYDAPGELAFGENLRHVRTTVHAGLYRDETARACDWHLPLSHAFEHWGDARAHDGTPTLLQPAIAPLYDTRSPHEVLALLAGDAARDGYAIVQRTWRAV